MGREGLMVTTLGLKFEAGLQHFRPTATGHQRRSRHDRDMKLRCVAALGSVYWKSNEQSSLEHRPRQNGLGHGGVTAAGDGLPVDERDADSRADPVHGKRNAVIIFSTNRAPGSRSPASSAFTPLQSNTLEVPSWKNRFTGLVRISEY